jgi:hypothetical protein
VSTIGRRPAILQAVSDAGGRPCLARIEIEARRGQRQGGTSTGEI